MSKQKIDGKRRGKSGQNAGTSTSHRSIVSLHPLTADLEHADAEQIGDVVREVVAAAEKDRITKLIQVCSDRKVAVARTNGHPLQYYYDVLTKVNMRDKPYRLCGDIMESMEGAISHSYSANYTVNHTVNHHPSFRYFMLMRFAWTSANMLIRDPCILCYADPTFALYQLYASEGSILERMNNYRG